MFVLRCFVLRLSVKAIAGLAGSKEETITKYLTVMKDSTCASFEEEVRNPNFMFGGDGKIVQIDEAFISRRKYNRGRRQAKEGLWVVGLTEVNTSAHEIDDPVLLEAIKERGAKRQAWSQRPRCRLKRRRRPSARRQRLFHRVRCRSMSLKGALCWTPTYRTKSLKVLSGGFRPSFLGGGRECQKRPFSSSSRTGTRRL